jgi:hypothetical protein
MIVLIDSLRNIDMFSVMRYYYLKIWGQRSIALLFTIKCQWWLDNDNDDDNDNNSK